MIVVPFNAILDRVRVVLVQKRASRDGPAS